MAALISAGASATRLREQARGLADRHRRQGELGGDPRLAAREVVEDLDDAVDIEGF